jgi:hypothetical protein
MRSRDWEAVTPSFEDTRRRAVEHSVIQSKDARLTAICQEGVTPAISLLSNRRSVNHYNRGMEAHLCLLMSRLLAVRSRQHGDACGFGGSDEAREKSQERSSGEL